MDVNDLKELYAEAKQRMDGQIEHVRREMAGVRTGRASTGLLDNVMVEAYGAQAAAQSGGDAVDSRAVDDRRPAVRPVDHGRVSRRPSALRISGSIPPSDGKVIRIPIPSLTEERRKELSKHVHKAAEEGRNHVRTVRRDANDRLKKMLKDSLVSEDDEKRGLDEVQKITDAAVKAIDELQRKKDEDLLGR